MLSSLLLAAAFEIGPFYEQRADFVALRPFWSKEHETTDVLWPVYTQHRDWWRFCWFTHWQDYPDGGYQFEIIPLWFNGRDEKKDENYWGLFPLWGHHPHILDVYDLDFCLWPIWHRYRKLRPSTDQWLTSNAVLFPFISWRDDGAWGVWPLCGINYQRESTHRYALWPIVTWADYRTDRDTSGSGSSWMVWPLCASVRRERERQTMIIPPLFGYAETDTGWRLRCPWPIVDIERKPSRSRDVIFPLYESVTDREFFDGREEGGVTRFGWRLVEIYRDEHNHVSETRVFPFWKQNTGHTRIWPFWERFAEGDRIWSGVLAPFPITWVDSVDRNWAKFWTFYESLSKPGTTEHSLFWGLIRWSTSND